MKRCQKFGQGPPPPLIWTKSKRTAAFFRETFPNVNTQLTSRAPCVINSRQATVITIREVPPLATFPKIQPIWYSHPSLITNSNLGPNTNTFTNIRSSSWAPCLMTSKCTILRMSFIVVAQTASGGAKKITLCAVERSFTRMSSDMIPET